MLITAAIIIICLYEAISAINIRMTIYSDHMESTVHDDILGTIAEEPDSAKQSTAADPRLFTRLMKLKCWEKAPRVPGRHPDRWRYDACGNIVCAKLTSCDGCGCHEYDHIIPYSKG